MPAPNSALPARDIRYNVEFANVPAPVPLLSVWKATGRPSTYGVISLPVGAVPLSTKA